MPSDGRDLRLYVHWSNGTAAAAVETTTTTTTTPFESKKAVAIISCAEQWPIVGRPSSRLAMRTRNGTARTWSTNTTGSLFYLAAQGRGARADAAPAVSVRCVKLLKRRTISADRFAGSNDSLVRTTQHNT